MPLPPYLLFASSYGDKHFFSLVRAKQFISTSTYYPNPILNGHFYGHRRTLCWIRNEMSTIKLGLFTRFWRVFLPKLCLISFKHILNEPFEQDDASSSLAKAKFIRTKMFLFIEQCLLHFVGYS